MDPRSARPSFRQKNVSSAEGAIESVIVLCGCSVGIIGRSRAGAVALSRLQLLGAFLYAMPRPRGLSPAAAGL
jgi:hypothetical protein